MEREGICNCRLGYFHDYNSPEFLYLNTYINQCKDNAKSVNSLNEYKSQFYRSEWEEELKYIKPIDYLDKRKGMTTLFNYCPECGKEIEWKLLKKML